MASTINASSTGSGGLITTGDASGELALQANGVTKATVNSTGLSLASTASINALNTFGFENRIINGAMVIDQRNAGASLTVNGNVYTLDRWNGGGVNDGTLAFQQVSDAPSGFTKSLRVTVSVADASLGATQYARVGQVIEGFNVADFAGGTANAATVTFSFWVKSSLTGTFGGNLSSGDESRVYVFQYTINTANTWEQKSVTVTLPSDGTWATDNSAGFRAFFSLGAGSTYTNTPNVWLTSYAQQASGNINVINTTSATWAVTGVQLEKGSQATSFDFRSIGTEFALCQRYFAKLGANPQGSSNYQAYGAGHNTNVNTAQNTHLSYPQFMRASPTIAFSGSIGVSASGSYINASLQGTYAGVSSSLLQTLSAAVGSANGGVVLLSNSDATAFISLTAEL
jgi:hypothetical protein